MKLKKQLNLYFLGITLIFTACSNDVDLLKDPTDSSTNKVVSTTKGNNLSSKSMTTSPSEIRGVKWKQHSDDNFIGTTVDWWLRKPSGTSKMDVINTVATKANAIVIRVDQESRFKSPTATNYDKAMNDIVSAIKQAKNNNVNLEIYLWARIWMERDGNPKYNNIEGGALAVRDWFTPVLTKAIEQGVLDNIKGIILVETNIDRIEDSKEYAKRITDKFNQVTAWNDPTTGKTFFRTRTFMMPGAGFGLDFRNVDNDGGVFLQKMVGRCQNFAFLYKFMRANHETVTNPDYDNVNINGTLRSWGTDMEKNDSTFTVQERKDYLNYFGLKKLRNYITTHKSTYPTTANIVFWGDKWDHISKIPPLCRHALHDVLITYNPNPAGYFFGHAADNQTNASANKLYLFDSSLSPNQIIGWSGMTVEEEWDGWPIATTDYK